MKTISCFFFLVALSTQLGAYAASDPSSDVLESDVDVVEPSLEETDLAEKGSDFSQIESPESGDSMDESEENKEESATL